MREIKFRAWHDEHKTMVNFDNKKASNDIYIACNILKLMADNSPFLMQYTGLTDKDGVEIYEGDIVKHPSGEKFVVIFELGKFVAKYDDGINSNIALQIGDRGQATVIGNIYENPELLN